MAHSPPLTSSSLDKDAPPESSSNKDLPVRCPLCHNESVSRGSFITHLFGFHRVSHQSPSFKTLVHFESKAKEVEQLLVKAVEKSMARKEQKKTPAVNMPTHAEAAPAAVPKMVRLVAKKSNKSAASVTESEAEATSASDSETKETAPCTDRLASLVARTKKRIASTDSSNIETEKPKPVPAVVPLPSSFSPATAVVESPFFYNGPPSPHGPDDHSDDDHVEDTERCPRKSPLKEVKAPLPSKIVISGEKTEEISDGNPKSRSASPGVLQLDTATDSDPDEHTTPTNMLTSARPSVGPFGGSEDKMEILGRESVSAFGAEPVSLDTTQKVVPKPSGRKRRLSSKSPSEQPVKRKNIHLQKAPSSRTFQRPCPKSKKKYPVVDISDDESEAPVATAPRSQRVKRLTPKMRELQNNSSMEEGEVSKVMRRLMEMKAVATETEDELSYLIKPLQVNLTRVHHEILIKRGRQASIPQMTTVFEQGTMVWAHVTGYPWWPAVVMAAPGGGDYFYSETRHEYHVLFMEKAPMSRGWVAETDVTRFVDWSQHKLRKGTRHQPRMNAGRKLLESIRDYSNEERCHFFSKSVNPKVFEVVGADE